ncbi:MAG TPA: hypothetical protein VEA60_08260, partial [Allosphingosinicella sp.]|nr:hypothetical protein [Allosphingosinicella sp.]
MAEGDVSRLRSREYCEAYLKSITTFPAPPAGFDPRTAGARELALYGFPARPRSRAKRDLARLWDKAFVRIPKPVRAQLEIDEVLLAGILERERKQRDGRFGPGGWG